ncbi:hypothetical protein BCV70DRAFT_118434 [Testicularia cyperi]|uniref:Uncharacterized protein n=1 Tax=Testicularia cyperi TaxID=1882483 RepID=A0A317XMV9_9BASI|nr:hypothetical protein BCV70DRAFT_118434 [Testicularia cyperi]
MSRNAVSGPSASKSSGASDNEPNFLDPTNDATFQSLKRLLSAPSISTQHLSLLSEQTLYGSITYYLSKLEVEHVGEFAGVISSSGCLWTPPPPSVAPNRPNANVTSKPTSKVSWSTETKDPDQMAASQTASPPSQTSPVPGQSLSAFLIARSTAISQAVAASVSRRTDLIIRDKKGSTGWGSRRALAVFISSIISGMAATEASGMPESYKASRGLPVPRFAVLCGLLNGLYLLKEQRRRRRDMSILEEMAALRSNPALGLSIRRHVHGVEDEWVVTLAEILDTLQGPRNEEFGPNTSDSAGEEDDADEWEKEFRRRAAQAVGSASITSLASSEAQRAALKEVRDVPLYLAAQLAPFVPEKKIQALDPVQLASATSDAILSLFEGPSQTSMLESLGHDLGKDKDGKITLDAHGATLHTVRGISGSTLFPLLGPLSKLLSRALAKAVTSLSPDDVSSLVLGTAGSSGLEHETFPVLVRMSRLASALENEWLQSSLAGVSDDDIAEASKKETAQLWATFKTLLFSFTMVFDSMMDALVDMCPSPTLTIPPPRVGETASLVDSSLTERKWPMASTSNLPRPYLTIVQTILTTFAHLYWITSTFGSDGFDVYRKVFYSALDVLGRDGEACIELLEQVRPDQIVTENAGADRLESNVARRSTTTYFLNVAEQLVSVVPDEVVEQMILSTARPYLEDTRYQETFESAHSVVLAIYSAKKRCMVELAPFYVDLLLSSFPERLSSTQLEYAFTTVVSALSDQDDSVAWWVVDRLGEEVERERFSQPTPQARSTQQGGYNEDAVDTVTPPTESAHPSNPDSTRVDSPGPASPHDRLLSLQLCLIACIPCINLVLLRSALTKVERYILQHKHAEHSSSSSSASYTPASEAKAHRIEMCEKTFDAIQGLNAATREEGLRWWLDNRARFGV